MGWGRKGAAYKEGVFLKTRRKGRSLACAKFNGGKEEQTAGSKGLRFKGGAGWGVFGDVRQWQGEVGEKPFCD